jgi:putative DNA primase/helicase
MTIREFLSRFDKSDKKAGYWMVRCPAHDDHKPSLSVSEGDGGAILLKCHARCTPEAVVAAMRLTMADLFAERVNGAGRAIEATYDYRDEDGKLLFQAVRYVGREFSQRRPDGGDGWIWKLKGVRRVLYRLPELMAADPTTPVFLVEGEKDVDRLRAGGLVATCSPMGAGPGKWRKEYAEALAGLHVVIIPDNDDPGREHAKAEEQSLRGVAASVKTLTLSGLPEKGDVSDWLNAGHTVEELRKLADDGAVAGVEDLTAQADDDMPPYSGFYESLQELHDTQTEPADYVLTGVRRRQVTLFLSVTNVGKSTILLNHCLAAAAARAWMPLLPNAPARPLKVLYFDGESTDDELKQDTLTMLKTIGGKNDALINFIPIVEPAIKGESLDLSNKEHFAFVKALIARERPDIIAIDTVGSLFTLFNENDNAEVKRKVIRPLKALAKAGNCAVIGVHHIGKRGENTTDEEEAYLGRGASAFGTDTRAVFTLKREKALGDGYVRLTLGKGKGVKFDPVNLSSTSRRALSRYFTKPRRLRRPIRKS